MTDYEAVIEILDANSSVTDLVAKLKNPDDSASAYTAIVFGDLPEEQDVYPAISVRAGTDVSLNGITTTFMTVDCWSDSMTDSKELAKAVDDIFTDSLLSASDFSFWSGSDILATVSDGEYHNTPVQIKITYIRR